MKDGFSTVMAWMAFLYSILLLMFPLSAVVSCFFNPLEPRCSGFSSADFVIILVALAFSLTGFALIFLKRPLIEILFFLMASCSISPGMMAGINPDLGPRLFYFHLALLAPITLHFYFTLLVRPLRKVERSSLILIYLLAAGLAAPFLLFPVVSLKQTRVYAFGADGIRIVFFVTMVWMILALSYAYRHFSTLASRRKIRLMCLGSASALTPLLLLTLLPQTIGANFVSAALTFPWLVLIPLIYFYAEFRTRLNLSEKNFMRVLVYYLLFVVIFCIYFIVIRMMRAAIPSDTIPLEVEGLILFALFFLFIPLRRRFTGLVYWFFYGDETDYVVALRHLEKSLLKVLDLQELGSILLDELAAAIKVRRAALFLKQNQQIIFVKAVGTHPDRLREVRLAPDGILYPYFSHLKAPVGALRLRKDLAEKALSEQEHWLIRFPESALWLPCAAEQDLQGLILLEARTEDDLFTQADKELLTDLIDHAGNAIRNVRMAEKLREGRNELARAHKMLLEVQEKERKRIARELHDELIQKLIGINYQIVGLKRKSFPFSASVHAMVRGDDLDLIRNELLEVISGVRTFIGELRPNALDALGLPVVLESYVIKLREEQGENAPTLEVNIDRRLSWLPESLSICIFRVAQEAIRNSLQHAAASTIFVDLYTTAEKVLLKVMDDGRGFQMPDRLSEFSLDGHYGLVGLRERVEYTGGSVKISSEPGKGTEIVAAFPIQGAIDEPK